MYFEHCNMELTETPEEMEDMDRYYDNNNGNDDNDNDSNNNSDNHNNNNNNNNDNNNDIDNNNKNNRVSRRECRTASPKKRTPTKTKQFKFATDSRLHKHERSSSNGVESSVEVPFESSLRKSITSPNYNWRPTLPSPFKFMLRKKLFSPDEKQQTKWESLAEATFKFHNNSSRFQRTTIDEEEKSQKPHKPLPRARSLVTIPVSPRLHTKERAKARNIRTPEKKSGTGDEVDNNRNSGRRSRCSETSRSMCERKPTQGAKGSPLTSYSFREPRTERKYVKTRTRSEDGIRFNSKDFGCDAQKPRKKFTPTKVKPFSFDERDKERYMKKEEKIKQFKLQEEKLHEFHARSLPSPIETSPTHKSSSPSPKKTSSTKRQPFQQSSANNTRKTDEKTKPTDNKQDEKPELHPVSKAEENNVEDNLKEESPLPLSEVNVLTEEEPEQSTEYEVSKEEREKEINFLKIENKLFEDRNLEEIEKLKNMRFAYTANPSRTFQGLQIHPSNIPVPIPGISPFNSPVAGH